MKIGLIALAYLTGNGSTYAPMARNLLNQAILSAVAKLDPERSKAYAEILANVKRSFPEPNKKTPAK